MRKISKKKISEEGTQLTPDHPSPSALLLQKSGSASGQCCGRVVEALECRELYGRLEDSGSPSGRHLICNSEHRVQRLLVSRGHTVRVWIDRSSQLSRFLVHYSGMYNVLI